eukprot:UN13617
MTSAFQMLLVVVALFLHLSSSQETITFSWKNCTAPNALGQVYNVSFNPQMGIVGENDTITGIGATSIDLGYDAFYKLSVQSEGIPLGSIVDNACNSSYLDLDGDYGRIYYVGMSCLINKGIFSVSQIAWINPDAPYFSGLTATATFNAYYQEPSKSVACIQVDMTFN